MLRRAKLWLPATSVDWCVSTILSRLGLACCQGVAIELGLRATLTFDETMCSLISVVVCEVHVGVGFSAVEEPGVVVNGVAMVA